MPRLLPAVLLPCVLCVFVGPGLGQGRTEKHMELGLSITRPSNYERLPVRPRERFGVLAYVEQVTPAQEAAGVPRANLDIYVVPRGSGEVIDDAEGFVQGVMAPVSSKVLRAGRQRYGYQPLRWELELVQEGVPLAGWVHAWQGPTRAIVVVGRCDPAKLGAEQRGWSKAAETMRLFDPVRGGTTRAKWERYYAGRRGLVGIEHRVQARLSLVEGWQALDSEHYIVLSHGVEESFVRELSLAVESLRGEFAKLCPPDGVLDQVATVRVCRDEPEYLAYGGWLGSVGYWSPGEEELVIFDARAQAAPGVDGTHYTRAVLFHEAFHQYVYYAADGIAPHPWFNEGMAEHFGGARLDGRSFRGVEPNRYRLENAQALLTQGSAYPWATVTTLEQQEFYADSARLYAQGWSMVHFLASSAEAQRHPDWRGILPTYFRNLRGAWTYERRRLGPQSSVEAARRRARERARSVAFEDVDLAKLEAAWRRYLGSLRMPSAR
jgi:Protein of unknown function (DUF1570)